MGVVYRARDPVRGDVVALKVLLSGGGVARERRFRREVASLLRLRHPNLISVLEHGEERGRPYLVMQLCEGESLDQHLKRQGPYPPRKAARIALTLARALAAAHAAGVLHRDVKPANVILDPRLGPVLTDFGLARELSGEQSLLTRSGVGLGSPGFWSPEQARGDRERVGPPSDVYSLGATLYALLTGESPHPGDSFHEVLVATLEHSPEPTGLDPELDAICLRCLAKDPTERFASAQDLADALAGYLRGAAASESPRRSRVRRASVLAAGAVALGGAAALFFGAQGGGGRDAEGPSAVETPSPAARASVLAGEGREHHRAKRYGPASEAYERALALDPTRTTTRYNYALVLIHLGREEEAEAELRRVLAEEPENKSAWLALGELSNRSERYAAALDAFARVRALAPGDGQAEVGRGAALYGLGRYPEALAAYTHAIELDASLPQAWGGRAATHVALKEFDEAVADYARAEELAPEDGGWPADRGRVLLRLGRGPEASAAFSRALAIGGERADLYLDRGRARLLPPLRDVDGAVADLERALVLYGPEHRLATSIRALIEQALRLRALERRERALRQGR